MHPDETTERLREGKRKLREDRRNMSLPEKLRQLVELQKIEIEMIRRRRPLTARERVWNLRQR